MATSTVSETTPERPVPTKLENLFTLYFKRGQTMQDFLFSCQDLKTAIEKGKDFCAVAQVKFQNVTPTVQDIDKLISIERSRNRI